LSIIGIVALVVGIWSYYPAIRQFVSAWNTEPDYSHGYLVIPLALCLLWLRGAGPDGLPRFLGQGNSLWLKSLRRNLFPGWGPPSLLIGGGLLALAVALRFASAWYFLESFDAWSLVVWVAAVTALLCGRKVLWWSLPAIGFLFFMIPLPFGAEQVLSLQLQTVATKLSCWTLQLLGQPALAEGHTILLGDHRLEVAQACSGLRLFVSIVAVAYFFLIAVPRSWWERTVLVVAALPIAVATNAMRIVVTGLLYQFASSEAAQRFAHDMAGFVMIPVAMVLFGLLLWYLTMLFPWEEELDVSAVVKQASL
jgi:exosortase